MILKFSFALDHDLRLDLFAFRLIDCQMKATADRINNKAHDINNWS